MSGCSEEEEEEEENEEELDVDDVSEERKASFLDSRSTWTCKGLDCVGETRCNCQITDVCM